MEKENILPSKDGYIDTKGMEERIKEKDKQKAEEFENYLQAMSEKEEKQRQELQELFYKAILSDKEDAEKKKEKELEQAKEQANKELDEKYEGKGVKSETTKKKDAAYRNLLGNL
ncbi:hypothetical protein [Vagococcus xieshaowenii]|uniref:DUF4355 domain-containing protein n=1 Tax=Vagococcus xieshaowenii TaxID=2562451 RepID=A0A4Z0D7K5_9ENTE|nr:hypothetical protein [Vagococcus xieshaowenii]QCA29158.1 hypothetical protein E4Z98_07460 [Vagococcus xieshaowenii]TFZ40864.1 hypothetical protein E4031_05630 [Vagococcus xieshaowenii]